MEHTEAKICQDNTPHKAHHTIENVYDDNGVFKHTDEVWCSGVTEPTNVTNLKGAIAQVLEMDEARLDEVLSGAQVDEAEERRQAEAEIIAYEARTSAPVDFGEIRAKDPELQYKMDAYEAQGERLQHQAYLKLLREAAENDEIKQYPNRAQRRANARAHRKANK